MFTKCIALNYKTAIHIVFYIRRKEYIDPRKILLKMALIYLYRALYLLSFEDTLKYMRATNLVGRLHQFLLSV